MSEKVDDCVDGLLTESDAKLRVLTHRSLDKLMYFAETRRAVIILDHDPECSSLYVSIWLRIVEWAATAEYARIVTLSTVEMPEWQKNITDGVTIMRMNDFRCLGGEGYPMQPLEKAVDRNDIAELIGRFLKHDSPPRTLVIVGPIAMIMDASQLLPDEADFLITGISSKTDFNSFIAKSPLDSHQSPIVLVVAPNVALSAPALHALKLANVTHGGIIGHGAGGPCYNDFLGTVVDDSLTLPPSEVDIDRASMYWSKSLSTPFVPCWMPVDRRQYENSSSSLYERFANRDLYTTVYKLVDFISLSTYPWDRALMALSSGTTLTPRVITHYAHRLHLPDVDDCFQAAFILSAAFYKSTSVEVKETLVYFAHIIANADACREAIEFVGQPPSESFRRIAIQDAIPGQFAPEGFLWTVLGFVRMCASGGHTTGTATYADGTLIVHVEVLAEIERAARATMKRHRLSPAEQGLTYQQRDEVMTEVLCSSLDRLFAIDVSARKAFSGQIRRSVDLGEHVELLNLSRFTEKKLVWVMASGNLRCTHDGLHLRLEIPDASFVDSGIVEQWEVRDVANNGELRPRPLNALGFHSV
ncbi:hypothetical protein ACHAQF_008178 [Verticillium nonalfalfae]